MKEFKGIIISIGIVVAILLIIGVALHFFYLRGASSDQDTSGALKTEIENKKFIPSGTETKILDQNPEKSDFPTIFYSGEEFSPKKINVVFKEDGTGCLFMLKNQSVKELLIRLSPYSKEDTYGFPYPVVPPQSFSLIDPRYHIADLEFHDHNAPEHSFAVHLDSGCAK